MYHVLWKLTCKLVRTDLSHVGSSLTKVTLRAEYVIDKLFVLNLFPI